LLEKLLNAAIRIRHPLPRFPRALARICRRFAATLAVTAFASTAVLGHAETLRVGATAGGIPFTFLDLKTNTIQGMMIDVVTEAGKRAGFDAQIQPMAFSSLVSSLTANKVDLLSAALFITAAHEQVMAFSDPIYSYGEALIVAKNDGKAYTSLAGLKDMVVGAQIGTIYLDALKKANVAKEIKSYDATADLMRDLNSGRIQAAIADGPVVSYYLKQGLYPETKIVQSYQPTMVGSLGIGMRKDETGVQQRINAALKAMVADGTMQKILAKWGLGASAQQQAQR
jgi:polar amino acid transport system substrate-binding protein